MDHGTHWMQDATECGAAAAPAVRRDGETTGRDRRLPPWPRRLPDAAQLAALGSVLCLYRRLDAPLARWRCAGHAEAHACVDAGGAREWISVHDAVQACGSVDAGGGDRRCARAPDEDDDRLRLYLLPDTDFLAWERMVAALDAAPESIATARATTACATTAASLHARLLARIACSARRTRWLAMPLRLHVEPDAQGWRLTAIPAALSPLGRRVACCIARSEGAEPVGCLATS